MMTKTMLLAAALLDAACALPPVASPITRNRQLESLEQAVRWPAPSPRVVFTLVNEYLNTHREREGFLFFDALAIKNPDRPLFLTLAGVFQARISDQQPLLSRNAWAEAAAAKLDRAAAAGGPLEQFFRGIVFAELPERFGRGAQAVTDLEATLARRDKLPPGFRRGAWNGLASAYAKVGRAADAAKAREQAGP